MLEGRGADLTKKKKKKVGVVEPGPNGRVPVSSPLWHPGRKWSRYRER